MSTVEKKFKVSAAFARIQPDVGPREAFADYIAAAASAYMLPAPQFQTVSLTKNPRLRLQAAAEKAVDDAILLLGSDEKLSAFRKFCAAAAPGQPARLNDVIRQAQFGASAIEQFGIHVAAEQRDAPATPLTPSQAHDLLLVPRFGLHGVYRTMFTSALYLAVRGKGPVQLKNEISMLDMRAAAAAILRHNGFSYRQIETIRTRPTVRAALTLLTTPKH